MKLYIVRHGESVANLQKCHAGQMDYELTDKGREDALKCRENLKGLVFDKVVSSPLCRASVTASKIACAIGCDDFSTDERLIERDFGEISGKAYDMNAKYITGNDEDVSGLEPVESVYMRMHSFVTENALPGKKIIAVSHGSATGVFTAVTKKAPLAENAKRVLRNCHRVVFSYDGCEILMEGYDISPENLNLLEIE